MIYLKITTNDTDQEHKNFFILKRHLQALYTLKKIGGFKRFNIDVIDVNLSPDKINYANLINWLAVFVFDEKCVLPLKAMFID